MDLEDYFKDAKIYVQKETFSIIKSSKAVDGAFVNLIDDKETTVILDEAKIADNQDNADFIEIEKGWKILTLDVVFPFEVCGVTAKIAACLANAGVSIMPISAFSRDHFLVKEKVLGDALIALQEIGLKIEN